MLCKSSPTLDLPPPHSPLAFTISCFLSPLVSIQPLHTSNFLELQLRTCSLQPDSSAAERPWRVNHLGSLLTLCPLTYLQWSSVHVAKCFLISVDFSLQMDETQSVRELYNVWLTEYCFIMRLSILWRNAYYPPPFIITFYACWIHCGQTLTMLNTI